MSAKIESPYCFIAESYCEKLFMSVNVFKKYVRLSVLNLIFFVFIQFSECLFCKQGFIQVRTKKNSSETKFRIFMRQTTNSFIALRKITVL